MINLENINLNEYEKKVFNSKFELIIVVMNYLKNNYNFNKDEISSIIKLHIDNNCSIDEEKYRTLLNEIDWINLNLEYYIFEFNIDIEKVINNSKREFLVLDNLFIENIENKNYYQKLVKEKEDGKVFNKEDLTYEYLYNLSVIENNSDTLIAELFNLKPSQVKNLRKKFNLSNTYLKRFVDYYPKKFIDFNILDNKTTFEKLYIFFNTLEYHCRTKKWNPSNINNYLEERALRRAKNYKITITNNFNKNTLNVTKCKTKKKSNGRKTNQREAFNNKIVSGKLGESIILNYEMNKMKELGYIDLIDDIDIISQTQDKNITFDGTGYDVISFNEKRERIYIESKCSLSNKEKIEFFISEKELEFINGELEGKDKEHCFIYYVYNVNQIDNSASIEIIDYEKFNTLQKRATNYFVFQE